MMPTSATFSEIGLEIYRQEIFEAQRIVAWIALRKLGYCEADIARTAFEMIYDMLSGKQIVQHKIIAPKMIIRL
jgi:hypothetical protein